METILNEIKYNPKIHKNPRMVQAMIQTYMFLYESRTI